MSSRTVTVVLHGNLRALHPGEIRINGSTCSEIISGLLRMIPTLKPRADRERKLVQVQGFTTEESFHLPITQDEIHVVPAMVGGKSGGFFKILLGVVLIGAALFLGPGVAAFGVQIGGIGGFLFNAGVSLLLGGILEFLSPQPKFDSGGQTDGSLYFGSTQNTTRIGTRIALLYGRMKVYGHLLSYNIDATIDSLQILPKDTTGGGTSGTPGVSKGKRRRGKGVSHGVGTAAGVGSTDVGGGGAPWGEGGVTDVGASTLGYMLLAMEATSPSGGVQIFDSDNSYTQLTFSGPMPERVRGLGLAPDNSQLFYSTWYNSPDPNFYEFSTVDFSEESDYGDIRTNSDGAYGEQLAISDNYIATIFDTNCFIFNRSDNTLVTTIAIGQYGYSCDFSPDESMIVIGSYEGGSTHVQVFSTATWSVLTTLGDAGKAVTSVKFSPDGVYLATAQLTNTSNTRKETGNRVYIYRVSDWAQLFVWDSETVNPPNSAHTVPPVTIQEMFFNARTSAWLDWNSDSTKLAVAYDHTYAGQVLPGGSDIAGNPDDAPLWSSVFYIDVPSYTITKCFGNYTDTGITGGTRRDYEAITGPIAWSKDDSICYAINNDTTTLVAFDTSGALASASVDYGGAGGAIVDYIKVTK